jgi:hypothetical protein
MPIGGYKTLDLVFLKNRALSSGNAVSSSIHDVVAALTRKRLTGNTQIKMVTSFIQI